MKPVILKTLLLILSVYCCNTAALAADYTAVASGNYSNTATWSGGALPPAPLGTNKIIIPSGITVTLDVDLYLNDAGSNLQVNYGGTLSSVSKNFVSISAGILGGNGRINIDSIYTASNTTFSFTGWMTVNRWAVGDIAINGGNLEADKELRFTAGITKLFYGTITTGINATVVYSGGTLGLDLGTVDVSNGYNLRYETKSYNINQTVLDTNYLKDIEIAVGSGNTVSPLENMTIPGRLTLTSGTFSAGGKTITFENSSSIATGGTGVLIAPLSSHIIVNTFATYFGTIRIGAGGISNLTINTNTTFRLATDMAISNSLKLVDGKIFADGNKISLSGNATLTGGSATSYIVTNTGGTLVQTIPASGTKFFPVGTENEYSPITIWNNLSANSSDISVSTAASVLQYGTSGNDLSATQSLVKTTWFVDAPTQVFDVNIEPQWPVTMEVNGFNAGACYISHFATGSWDTHPYAAATTTGNMKAVKRNNINSAGAYTVVDTGAYLSINDDRYNSMITGLYPNPATNIINLNYTGNSKVNVAVYNAVGIMVKTFSITKGVNPVNISGLNNGIYYIRNTDGDEQISTKFLKL